MSGPPRTSVVRWSAKRLADLRALEAATLHRARALPSSLSTTAYLRLASIRHEIELATAAHRVVSDHYAKEPA